MKKVYLILLTVLFLCSCSDSSDEQTPEAVINNFSLIIDGTNYQCSIDNKNNTITNTKQIPADANLMAVKSKYSLSSSKSSLKISGVVQTSEVTENDYTTNSVVYDLYTSNVKVKSYSIVLNIKPIEKLALSSITFLNDELLSCNLTINNNTITNDIPIIKSFDLTSIRLKYKSNNANAKLYYNDVEVTDETKINCSESAKLVLKNNKNESVEYILQLTKSLYTINVKADSYLQTYKGGGTSFALYYGHVKSMNQSNQEKFYQLMFRDVDMKYVQSYFGNHDDDKTCDNAAEFIKRARVYNSDLESVFVIGSFHEDLTVKKTISADKTIDALNVSDPDIYKKVARWMFSLMTKMYDKNEIVSIFSMANEPDYEKSWKWGYENSKEGLAKMIANVIPELKKILADKSLNPNGLILPKIMAPSTISARGCKSFVDEWRKNYKDAWNLLDIVATHQYNCQSTTDADFKAVKSMLDGKDFMQTEQHVNKGDDLGTLPFNQDDASESQTRGVLSMMAMFQAAVQNGCTSWFYFETNHPGNIGNAGLIQTKWNGSPEPYKYYYSFKQLNSLQSKNSSVLSSDNYQRDKMRVICFRKKGENKIVVHVSNNTSDIIPLDLSINNPIKKVTSWKTDANTKFEKISEYEYHGEKTANVYLSPYSLMSFEIEIN